MDKQNHIIEAEFDRQCFRASQLQNELKPYKEEIISHLKCQLKEIEGQVQKMNQENQIDQQMSALIDQLKLQNQKKCGQLASQMLDAEQYLHNLEKGIKELEVYKKQVREQKQLLRNQTNEYIIREKKLNQELQELKGNIRIFCRVRPFLSKEHEALIHNIEGQSTLAVTDQSNKKIHRYSFERIFDVHENQQDIFNELAQLIQSSIDGNKVTVFSYGQTGSGKTFTMLGGSSQDSQGIIFRSSRLIFDQVSKYKLMGKKICIRLGIKQFYLEEQRDLINLKEKGYKQSTIVEVKSFEDVQNYIYSACQARVVGKTACNEHSSRSHLVINITISSGNQIGTLNFIDLAGSQRTKVSNVQGLRLKQAIFINQSLTTLSRVISAIKNKQKHVPYRQSILARQIQEKNSDRNSHTVMIINISPQSINYEQTIASLKFGNSCKDCRLKAE